MNGKMWVNLLEEQRTKYKQLIINFASLSEAFSQKAEHDEDSDISYVAPIVNSKYQETVFQKVFNATNEDFSNTSYDASLVLDSGEKYLVGIKAFGIEAGDQKIAQFKSVSSKWIGLLEQIKSNAEFASSKEDADLSNKDKYLYLAREIAYLRNERIESSKAQAKGFLDNDDENLNSVYHVLMTSKKGETPKIFVGEIDYLPIDIDKITILGSTKQKNPTNFKFFDGHHTYKYTSADSQLLMDFRNKEIIQEVWPVKYIENPLSVFENIHKYIVNEDERLKIVDSVSWMIADKNGTIHESSGFNAFDGVSKLSKKYREKRINQINDDFSYSINSAELSKVMDLLTQFLLKEWPSADDKKKQKSLRNELMQKLAKIGNEDLLHEVEKLVYRSSSEVYIPIPDSRKFHLHNPNFFGEQIGTFKDSSNKLKLPKDKRVFDLRFIASGNVIKAYINQDNGKAIQSIKNQDILGDWLLKKVFQLKDRELLTEKRLDEIGINGIRLIKYSGQKEEIGLEFIWIDKDNPPTDAIGWVAENIKR